MSVAISTRVGNLLGATLDDAARTAANVGMLVSSSIGLLNGYSPAPSPLTFPQFLGVPYLAVNCPVFVSVDLVLGCSKFWSLGGYGGVNSL